MKKLICPKCGNQHDNCDTTKYTCVNCKGPHMAMYKKCPTFLKEKEIRDIMTKQNCTYRRGLETYLKNKGEQKQTISMDTESNRNTINSQSQTSQNTERVSYRDILVTKAVIHNEILAPGNETGECLDKSQGEQVRDSKKIGVEATKSDNSRSQEGCKNQLGNSYAGKENTPFSEKTSEGGNIDFFSIYQKVKDICFSANNWYIKVQQLGKILIEICSKLILKCFNSDDMWLKIISMFKNG